ncbi:helix-turn-helix transcriptional regulator [Mucilaginibacter sp.]|uniref:helix-turn-helix domain-containing protein n=1 Tax=Mucilaginibacter sp. TaxID=1882438 RepID=UPI00261E774D|nr:helix-turn-helix transcriptional regulator [Mucilaginibacter sp.]MDB4923556.1 hypothetical protein [Mucilaginibacter sp.]
MGGTVKRRRNGIAINVLSKNIRKYRKEQKLTITKLAELLDMDYAQLGRIERGLKNPTVSFIFDVAAQLEIKPSQLLEE